MEERQGRPPKQDDAESQRTCPIAHISGITQKLHVAYILGVIGSIGFQSYPLSRGGPLET
jgi:hypothetical protein